MPARSQLVLEVRTINNDSVSFWINFLKKKYYSIAIFLEFFVDIVFESKFMYAKELVWMAIISGGF